MRIKSIYILTLIVVAELLSVNIITAAENVFSLDTKSSDDTSNVNSFIRKAFSYVPAIYRSPAFGVRRAEGLKTAIDSAELMCGKKKMEYPGLLYLARAEYFFMKADFTSASMESGAAMKKAERTNDAYSAARVLNFQ
jgi:hypothetical protein